jgi:uncharacterized protein YndB with AHSA1/START domain
MSNNTTTEVSAVQPLTITHLFAAPRDVVWEAWTKQEHLTEWWGPEMFTNPICEVDVRPGGLFRIDMKGPDGVMYPAPGTFIEVREPERLVFSQTPLDAAGNVMFETLQTAVFTEQGAKTLLTLTAQVISTTPGGDQFLAGLDEPWAAVASRVLKQSLGKLDRLLDALIEEGATR